ncbi:hypothetical protein [Aliarcobacter butzleri]|uniref:hypothetical protein n=1 Tax=Aliarcobacter butzleri TaxID=28197 RepID=UPI0021B34080|nr:hypothetical protein [Aliarcobacter butzleri]MCT7632125.1 hypothetical protein [Aliarcobacter butzleri]
MKTIFILMLILLNLQSNTTILKNNDTKLITLEKERLNYVLLKNSNECILSTTFFSNLIEKNIENNEELLDYIKQNFKKIETKFDINNNNITVVKLNYKLNYIKKSIVFNFFKEENECKNTLDQLNKQELLTTNIF